MLVTLSIILFTLYRQILVLNVAWKRWLHQKIARFALFRLIKKRSFNLLCVLDLCAHVVYFTNWSHIAYFANCSMLSILPEYASSWWCMLISVLSGLLAGAQNFDVIRFATYRTACKLRFIQKRTNRRCFIGLLEKGLFLLLFLLLFIHCECIHLYNISSPSVKKTFPIEAWLFDCKHAHWKNSSKPGNGKSAQTDSRHLHETLIPKNLGKQHQEQPAGKVVSKWFSRKLQTTGSHKCTLMTQSLKTCHAVEQVMTTIHEDCAAYKASISSLIMEIESVIRAFHWIASRGVDSQTPQLLAASQSQQAYYKKVEIGWRSPDWHVTICDIHLQDLWWKTFKTSVVTSQSQGHRLFG